MINTRDEPHADSERFRRLHVIVGDSNMSEVATYLKVGTTALVLDMIEDGFFDRPAWPRGQRRTHCARSHAMRRSRERVRLQDGRAYTALEIQLVYLEACEAHVRHVGGGADAQRGAGAVEPSPGAARRRTRWRPIARSTGRSRER